MPRTRCCGHPEGRPCTCEMGNLYRFVEPIVLVSLARLGTAHGYQIAQKAEQLAITHAGVDIAAVYRTLRRLEAAGHVLSAWETSQSGPARREYTLTQSGREHLAQWATVLGDVMGSLEALISECKQAIRKEE